MKSDYRERAIRFLYSIIPYLAKNSSIYAAVEKYNCDKRRNVIFNYGSVRNVLITSDYVIKWNNNIKANYYIGTCENEKQMYDIAVKNGFGYLFAEPTMVEV